jgi:hypothetical protein
MSARTPKATPSCWPGKTKFRQAMNCIGDFIFERGMRGDLDLSVTTRHTAHGLTIVVIHADGLIHFDISRAELEAQREAMTPRQKSARRFLDELAAGSDGAQGER